MKKINHDTSPVWMMRRLDCAKRRAAERLFSQKPLQKPPQYFLLFEVERATLEGKPPTQGDLARRMRLSPATITASLACLERYGYITRESDPKDLRKNRVIITKAGQRAAEECRISMDNLEISMLRGFSKQELETLGGFVQRMEDNLNEILKEEGKP